MLENLVTRFCNNYLGKYLENLNTDQLSISLLQGEVKLENVPLKRDILDHFGQIPLQIHAGLVGRICFRIPLTKIKSEPWVISFEQLYLLVGPKDKNKPYNEESEETAALERKMAALDSMEKEWRSQIDARGELSSSSDSSSMLSYGANFFTNVVQNVQLKIKDIHIRYEDGVSCPGKTFACGVRVDSLTAETCDENWIPKFISSTTQDMMYKLLELSGLALYWDTNTELFSNLPTQLLTQKLMQPCSAGRNEFLLAPVSGYAHLKRDCSSKPLRSLNQPRISCNLQVDLFSVEIRDVQFHQLVQCGRSLEMLTRGLQFRRWRVDSENQVKAIRQWRFAGRCILGDIRKRNQTRNWPFVIRRASAIVLYVRQFKEYLLNPKTATAESKLHRQRVEVELELEELQMLRLIAKRQAQKSKQEQQSKPQPKSGASSADSESKPTLFRRMFSSWRSSTVSDPKESSAQSAKEESIEQEILETFEDAMRDNTMQQRDILPLKLSYTLNHGLVRLSTSCNKIETGGQEARPLLEFECENVVTEWESRPRLKSHKFHYSLGNVWARDYSNPTTLFPLIVRTQGKDVRPLKPPTGVGSLDVNITHEEILPFFDLVYEKSPPGSNLDHRLKINSLPVAVVYNHQLIKKIVKLFSISYKDAEETSLIGQRLRQTARSGLEEAKRKTRRRLVQTLVAPSSSSLSHQSWDLLINISAPHILVPKSVASPDSLLLVVDFGHFHVSRTAADGITAELPSNTNTGNEEEGDDDYGPPCSTPPNELAETTKLEERVMKRPGSSDTEEGDVSDKYNVHLTDLQLLVCRINDDWEQARLKGTSSLHLVDRFSILTHVEKCALISNSTLEKPFMTLAASLPHLVVHINEPKIQALVSLSKLFRSDSRPSPYSSYESVPETSESDKMDLLSTEEQNPELHWILATFSIEQLSVEVQSRERSVAELQVGGVQASYTMRPSSSSIHLTVHTLFLVDAMQTLGSDYDLLIASQKQVNMDDTSSALIVVDISTVEPLWVDNQPKGRTRKIKILFNSLDVIANQDTVVELASLFGRLMPAEERRSLEVSVQSASQSSENQLHTFLSVPDGSSTEITFDFHRLAVLLLRSSVKDDNLIGCKLATLTVSDVWIHGSLATDVLVQGSLGGVQVLDLTPKGQKHRRIVSVGQDPLVSLLGLNQTTDKESNQVKALSFNFASHKLSKISSKDGEAKLSLELRMASLCYAHSAQFLADVAACVSEFQRSVSNMKMSLKSNTAAEMTDNFNPNESSSAPINKGLPLPIRDTCKEESLSSLFSTIRLNALLESPILVLPRSANSPQVLVAHLGRIELKANDEEAELTNPMTSSEKLESGAHKQEFKVDISDMSLHSLDVDEKWKGSFSQLDTDPSSFLRITAQELYSCTSPHGRPILRNTTLKFSLNRITNNLPISEVCDVFQVNGCVVSSLQISLSKALYRQIIETLDNLDWNKEETINSSESVPESKSSITKPPLVKQRKLLLNLSFKLPRLSIELLDYSNKAIVRLFFEDFLVSYVQSCTYSATIRASLKSLMLEDLITPTKYRRLMASNNETRSDVDNNNLVSVKFVQINPESPDFAAKYNSTHQFVEINLNALDVTANLESWIMMLNFFRTTPNTFEQQKSKLTVSSPEHQDCSKVVNVTPTTNSRLHVEIRSFNLLLIRKDCEIAKATLSALTCKMASLRGDLDISGKLGGISVEDLTPAGQMYRQRFTTSGNKALEFQVFCFTTDDPQLSRDCDVRLNVNIESMLYVHTQRFYTELFSTLELFKQLHQMATSLSTDSKSSTSSSEQTSSRKCHGTRILLNVEVGSPVIMVPVSSSSEHLLVIDLGRIATSNKFVTFNGSASPAVTTVDNSTLGVKGVSNPPIASNTSAVLVDVLEVQLLKMNLYTGQRQNTKPSQTGDVTLGPYHIRPSGQPLIKEPCDMKLVVRRNLDSHLAKPIPDMDISGLFPNVKCYVNENQFKLLRALVSLNLGEAILLVDPIPLLPNESFPEVSPSAALRPNAQRSKAQELGLKLRFKLSQFSIELLNNSNKAIVRFCFEDFFVSYVQSCKYTAVIQTSLKSLLLEDLTMPENSKYRRLIASNGTRSDVGNNDLVLVKILQVDPDSPDFAVKYNSTRQFFKINLNALDVTMNIESWVMVLDFLDTTLKASQQQKSTLTVSSSGHQKCSKGVKATSTNSRLEVEARSFNLLLLKCKDYEVAKATLSHLTCKMSSLRGDLDITGKLGGISVEDLTPAGQIYRERFSISGNKALEFKFFCFTADDPQLARDCDVRLNVNIESMLYVHTQRFYTELFSMLEQFKQLQQAATSLSTEDKNSASSEHFPIPLHSPRPHGTRILFNIDACSSVILMPVCSTSQHLLAIDLGHISTSNKFVDEPVSVPSVDNSAIISIASDPPIVLVDAIKVKLSRMNVYIGERQNDKPSQIGDVPLGSYLIRRSGQSLLKEPNDIELMVRRNVDSHLAQPIPDIDVCGSLSTVEFCIDEYQYKMLRGLVSLNLGEAVDFLRVKPIPNESKWTKFKLRIDLVKIGLEIKDYRLGPFFVVDIIDSRVVYEKNSDDSEDMELFLEHVIIKDARNNKVSLNSIHSSSTKANVFTQILEPITKHPAERSSQVEIHYRSTEDFTTFTVMLNNTRLLAVFDYWTLIYQFFLSSHDEYCGDTLKDERQPGDSDTHSLVSWTSTSSVKPIARSAKSQKSKVELFKIIISDVEVVFIEDTSLKDSSAITLKGALLLTYQPQVQSKPFSCHLNGIELFSSQLNLRDETASSIIDPVNITIEVVGKSNNSVALVKGISNTIQQILEIQVQQLIVRLSRNDVKLLTRIVDTIPRPEAQSTTAVKQHDVGKIKVCGIEINADCISLCVIDNYHDTDSPLLEGMAHTVHIRQTVDATQANGEGSVNCHQLAVEYYNRVLSGWEPLIEPFKFHLRWNFLPFHSPVGGRQRPFILFETEGVINVNCTKALLELVKTVKMERMEDSYVPYGKDVSNRRIVNSAAVRQRSPFTLHNATGAKLKFRTETASLLSENASWIQCNAGQVVPFSFVNNHREVLRNHDSHQMQTNQLVIEIDGWMELSPVSVDRVGVYFRYATVNSSSVRRSAVRVERELERILVVIAVKLDGSARKIVTIRSALQLTNNLEETVELRLEPPSLNSLFSTKTVCVPSRTTYPIPMAYLMAKIFVRPIVEKMPHTFGFCKDPIEWRTPTPTAAITRECNSVVNNNQQHLAYQLAVSINRENFPPDNKDKLCSVEWVAQQPAHTITLLNPLVVVNLLPYQLLWEIKAVGQIGIIKPSESTAIHTVINVSLGFQIAFCTENFMCASDLVIGTSPKNSTTCLQLYDNAKRILLLQVKISSKAAGSVKLTISAPYWLVNKADIPLVFRQEGVQQDAAGQFGEHEMSCSLSPMLFSFAERGSRNPTLTARVGNGLHPGCKPQWCQPFALQNGVRTCNFKVSHTDGRPELVYSVGITVESGKGRHRETKVVTFAPCYQLYNKSSAILEVSQAYFTTTSTNSGANQATYPILVPGCYLPFHWSSLDKDQLLCVRLILDSKNCHWSSSFAIQKKSSSFHVNIRDCGNLSHFLRVDIVQREYTYCVIFNDANKGVPPPFRIVNLSQVPILFHQSDLPEKHFRTIVQPSSSLPYVLDDPKKPARLIVIAPGGASASYDMTLGKDGSQLTYENLIYVYLTITCDDGNAMSNARSALDPINKELVLDVTEGTRLVILNQKETGKRSQLWRMIGGGMLMHVGSSPALDPSNPQMDMSQIFVLDIVGAALQLNNYVQLALQKPDTGRQLTQTWRFTEDGRLRCGQSNVFVQAKDGFHGIRPGNEVVLGPSQPIAFHRMPNGIPAEQAIKWRSLLGGSGSLSVEAITDGPTKVLQVSDSLTKSSTSSADNFGNNSDKSNQIEKSLQMHFKGGIGLSIVNHSPPEELAYCRLSDVLFKVSTGGGMLNIEAKVQSFQVDNCLQDSSCPVVIHVTPSTTNEDSKNLPAFQLTAHCQMTDQFNVDTFKDLAVRFKNLTINIEEKHLLKVLDFAGLNQSDSSELEQVDEGATNKSQRSLSVATSDVEVKRYYFGLLKLSLERLRVSVYTSSKLPDELNAFKRKLGLTLIQFEDANIELRPFFRADTFETAQNVIDSISKHYQDDLKKQAAKILISTDFLGNPLGLMNDVSEGVSGLFTEGNVGGLVQNVTFGMSNSVAKVTGSLSHGVGRVAMDSKHEEARQNILKSGQGSSNLVTGLKGFGFGVLGGVTSIVKQTSEGASTGGLTGLVGGFGKGLVGTVAKPAAGVLDLATGVASSFREISRSSSKEIPSRIRPPRVATGPGGILPRYSEKQGRGQELLFQLNNHQHLEKLIAYEELSSGADSLHMLVSSERIRLFTMRAPSNKEVIIDIHLSELQSINPAVIIDYGTQNSVQFDVELLVEPTMGSLGARPPQVPCHSESLAKRVTQEIKYAKCIYEETRHSLSP